MINWFRNRKYKSGTIWCFWRWTDVDSEYITRLHIVKTPWFAICLHWIHKPDPEPYLHDHPVTFLSIILKGWYNDEVFGNKSKSFTWWRHHSWFNFIKATDAHSIVTVAPGGCVTLCFMGPKTREWGFHTPEGWIMWKDYYKKQREEKQNANDEDILIVQKSIIEGVNDLTNLCHSRSVKAGWFHDLKTGKPKERNRAEMICLMHSELSEAMEGERKNLMDDKLPHRPMAEVEMADAVIRIADYCAYCGYDLAGAIIEKIVYNGNRADHKIENRMKDGGKQF